MTIQLYQQTLPHDVTLSCRASGERGRPVLMFLHGFPEAAFVWDELLEHFAAQGYRCIAPNLRGFERSTQPKDVKLYRPKYLVQDIAALAAIEGAPLECLVAHDWGGAVAWNLANQHPELAKRLAIINSPHPGTFLRELKTNPRQQAASAYMDFLIRPDSETLLRANDYERMWGFFSRDGADAWMTDELKAKYREVWDLSLEGGCNYYRASPLRPSTAAGIEIPLEMLTIDIPTFVLWGMEDRALPPELVEGLGDYIPDLELERVPGASHWIVHEQPALVMQRLGAFLNKAPARPAAAS
ncbi:alpha/beta fold hydrolase [Ramlibacter albus]|uniref:Alpha/beta hydrolase n=1 Tax=Ramlibacter albus TaxID=2079448 RepID=A0A923M996_9BURK|nr:alpha/beta hydrolase [Ramlibacter albus]MBC5764852.1 alpha/beta hydrolase [Ramlibacter albus]